MYNRRVPKNHPRLEANGAIDELNAALGIARAAVKDEFITTKLFQIQKDLVDLMGEIATESEDLERYAKDGYKIINSDLPALLETWIKEIESQKISFKHWATPGATMESATLDMGRTIARRAERRVEDLVISGLVANRCISIYLNRMSDLLWLMARWVETKRGVA